MKRDELIRDLVRFIFVTPFESLTTSDIFAGYFLLLIDDHCFYDNEDV